MQGFEYMCSASTNHRGPWVEQPKEIALLTEAANQAFKDRVRGKLLRSADDGYEVAR
jgi:hypothetical protein